MNPVHFCFGALVGWLVGIVVTLFVVACCRVPSDAERRGQQ